MLVYGFGSITAWNPEYKMASKTKFLEMKIFETLAESSIQFYFNYTYLVEFADVISPINYISLAISFVSILAGIFGGTTKCSEEQKKIEIQPAGKLIITLVVASWFSCFLSFTFLLKLDSDTMLLRYWFISTILRFCLVSVNCTDEFFYITDPSRQRLTPHEQMNGLFCRIFSLLFQPTLVNLKHSKLHHIFFTLLKILPTVVVHEFILMYMYTDFFSRAFYPFSVEGAAIVEYYTMFTLLNLLNIIYLFKQDWFYITKPEEPSLPDDIETSLSAQVSQTQGTLWLAQDGKGTAVLTKDGQATPEPPQTRTVLSWS